MPEINVLYFASLGEKLSCENESIPFSNELNSINKLKNFLSSRNEVWYQALSDPSIKCAINHNLQKDDHVILAGDEIAFFPPVTGG